MNTEINVTCLSSDCPERTGGKCWGLLPSTTKSAVRELRRARKVYDVMELDHGIDTMESPEREFVTWRGWKMIRNVISDRIEEITGGSRV